MPKTVSSVYTIGLTPLFYSRRPCYLLLFHPRRRGCPLPPLLAALPLPLSAYASFHWALKTRLPQKSA